MLEIDKPILLPLQQPYPLIACFGYIEAQMATLLVQNKDDEVDSYPIVSESFHIDGQMYTEDIDEDFYPQEEFFKLGCNVGDKIYWHKFIAIARLLFHHKTDLDLCEIWNNLAEFKVFVEDRPTHFYVLIKDFNTDDSMVNFTFCNDMAFKWDTPQMPYASLVEQVVNHLLLAPEASVHFLHQRPNDSDFHYNLKKLETDVRTSLHKERRRKLLGCETIPPPEPDLMWKTDLMAIAKYIQNCLPEGCSDKNDVLLEIKEHFMLFDINGDYIDDYDDYIDDYDDYIWDFIKTNNLLPDD